MKHIRDKIPDMEARLNTPMGRPSKNSIPLAMEHSSATRTNKEVLSSDS